MIQDKFLKFKIKLINYSIFKKKLIKIYYCIQIVNKVAIIYFCKNYLISLEHKLNFRCKNFHYSYCCHRILIHLHKDI